MEIVWLIFYVIKPLKSGSILDYQKQQRQLPIMEQLTLTEFFEQDDFSRHVRRIRKIYRKRHQTLMEALTKYHVSEFLQIHGTDTGLHVLLEINSDLLEDEIVKKASKNQVSVYPMKPYRFNSQRKGILLGFAHTDENAIWEGIKVLSRVLHDLSGWDQH